jgi:hypothetical protein
MGTSISSRTSGVCARGSLSPLVKKYDAVLIPVFVVIHPLAEIGAEVLPHIFEASIDKLILLILSRCHLNVE